MFASGSYRWVVVAAATLGLAAAFGAASTISVLIGPFEANYGWLRSETSFAFTLLSVGAAVGGLLAGRLADRLPIGSIAMAGAVVVALSLILVGQQSSIRAIQLVYLTLGLFGFSCLYGPLLTAVTGWFDRGHGLALGIVASGGVLGQAAVPPIFQALVAGHGWRQASVLLGCGYLVVIVPAMTLVRKSPARAITAGSLPAIWPVPPILSLALIGAAALFCCALMAVPTVHLFALISDRGFGSAAAARTTTILMLAGWVGRIGTGVLVDRIGSLAAYAVVSAVQTATVGLFLASDSLGVMTLVAAIYGIGFGGVMTAMVCCVRHAVPGRMLGSAMALVGLLAWLGMGLGSLQAGFCFDLTGSYFRGFEAATLTGLLNLAALGTLALLIRRRSFAMPA